MDQCFDFGMRYFLSPSKASSGRTSGATRGLGETLDAFMGGKLAEIAVTGMIESVRPDKSCNLNFALVKSSQARTEPDIISISEKGNKRKPNHFVEIKRISSSDRWAGLTEEQFNSMKKGQPDLEKIFIIGVELFVEGSASTKQKDLLGAYLKALTKHDLFRYFCNINDARAKIEYIISGNELDKFGKEYKQGELIFETEIFQELSDASKKQILKKNPIFNYLGSHEDGQLKEYEARLNYPKDFFPLKVTGKYDLYEKRNAKSYFQVIHCIEDVIVESDLLGKYELSNDKMYKYFLGTLGRNPKLNRNNIWIAKHKLSTLLADKIIPSPLERLLIIAENI